jgi:hypothetical protein
MYFPQTLFLPRTAPFISCGLLKGHEIKRRNLPNHHAVSIDWKVPKPGLSPAPPIQVGPRHQQAQNHLHVWKVMYDKISRNFGVREQGIWRPNRQTAVPGSLQLCPKQAQLHQNKDVSKNCDLLWPRPLERAQGAFRRYDGFWAEITRVLPSHVASSFVFARHQVPTRLSSTRSLTSSPTCTWRTFITCTRPAAGTRLPGREQTFYGFFVSLVKPDFS